MHAISIGRPTTSIIHPRYLCGCAGRRKKAPAETEQETGDLSPEHAEARKKLLQPVLEVILVDCIDLLYEQDMDRRTFDNVCCKMKQLVQLSSSNGALVVFAVRDGGWCARNRSVLELIPERCRELLIGG